MVKNPPLLQEGDQLVKKVLFLRDMHHVTAPTPTPPRGEGLYCEGTAYPQTRQRTSSFEPD